jgi:hypothetical protein
MDADVLRMTARRSAQLTVYAIALLLIGCASGGNSIKLASGQSVEVVRVGYQVFQQYGGYPAQYTLTIRYKTTLPLEASKLKSEVTDVWKYFVPVINRRHWDRVKIEPMTFGFMMMSWQCLPFVYRKTAEGWSDPFQSPPIGPEFGMGTIPQ